MNTKCILQPKKSQCHSLYKILGTHQNSLTAWVVMLTQVLSSSSSCDTSRSIVSFYSAPYMRSCLVSVCNFTSLRFPWAIRAICLSIFLASSTLRSWGMGTTGPFGLEQHLLSQLARGVRNCVAPRMSMQQWSPNSKSCKNGQKTYWKRTGEAFVGEEEKAINGSIRIKAGYRPLHPR